MTGIISSCVADSIQLTSTEVSYQQQIGPRLLHSYERDIKTLYSLRSFLDRRAAKISFKLLEETTSFFFREQHFSEGQLVRASIWKRDVCHQVENYATQTQG